MSHKRTVRGVPGRKVIDPETDMDVTDTPITVEDSTFWRRRIRDGDVEEVKTKAFQSETAVEEAPTQTKSKSKN